MPRPAEGEGRLTNKQGEYVYTQCPTCGTALRRSVIEGMSAWGFCVATKSECKDGNYYLMPEEG